MYFRLNPECYLVRGKKRGAIFDLIDAKIYALDQSETELVTSCEKNNPVQDDTKFLRHLKQLCLGNFYNNSIYVQKLRVGSRMAKNDPLNPLEPPELHRAFLEINNACNRDCWFCGYYGIKRSLGCMGCNKWKETGKVVSEERWRTIVDELKDLDCKDIFITGGDLTLVWDNTMNILNYATEKFDNIYIILHQQSLSSDKINDLSNKAKLIVQTEDLKKVKSKNCTTLLVVNPENVDYVSDVEHKDIIRDFVIEDGSSLSNNLPIVSKRKISPVNMYRFLNNVEYHPCLGHTVAICYNGNVIPCPMMRGHSFGNIRNRKLYTIFEKEWEHINKFWRLNLDKIEKCTDCEFRYSCTDCRSLEENLTGDLEGKRLCCYNPEEGEWL
jgi:radical SAM protein with 4Fe4S-binding SPASM domain